MRWSAEVLESDACWEGRIRAGAPKMRHNGTSLESGRISVWLEMVESGESGKRGECVGKESGFGAGKSCQDGVEDGGDRLVVPQSGAVRAGRMGRCRRSSIECCGLGGEESDRACREMVRSGGLGKGGDQQKCLKGAGRIVVVREVKDRVGVGEVRRSAVQ
ncbi:hypothetical protein AAG906_020241 [Vitis piasezkii]